MPLPFRKISQDQLSALVARYPFVRPIDSVLLLPGGSPGDEGFSDSSLVALWKRDTGRGEPDVTWHLAVDPEGGLWLGRDWNLPAGPRGSSSSDTAFVILLLDGAPREAAERAASTVRDRAGAGAEGAGDPVADALVMELMRGSGTVAPAPAAGRQGLESVGEEGVFSRKITAEMKEALRPHVINLTEGKFSTGGLFDTSPDDVDALFGEHLERAVAGHGPGDPLRIAIWAHGGLVNEETGLFGAYDKILWWRRNGVYPIYFVWETGFWKSVGQILGGRGGEEGVFDFTDKRLEEIARRAGGPSVWGVMKQNAHAASAPSGGALYAARRLAEFCQRHPGAVELHALGHSAGSIFHASFLPAALDAGVPPFKALHLLAPAVRVDLFLERLAPRLGPGKGVERTAIFTMNKDRERDDNCAVVYRKSLLYLIHFALEEEREKPILGLEISLRGNDDLKRMFGLGGAGGTPIGEVIWSKTTASAPLRSRSESTSHGGFDDDAATLDSVLRRILDRDDIPLSFKQAGTLTPETAVTPRTPAPTPAPVAPAVPTTPGAPPDIILGEEEEGVAGEEEGVPFVMLDAIERATEAAEGIGVQAAEPALEGAGLEGVGDVEITFGTNASRAAFTDFSRGVLTDILRAAGLSRAVVSSTSRSPADQARVMFANLERQGVEAQKRLYKEPGRKVIDVYAQAKRAGKSAAEIQRLMTEEIVRLGPTTVSRHASDPKVLNVFDVAPSSISNRQVFEAKVRAEGRVTKFLLPPDDPGYHLEIPQPRLG